MAKQIDFEVKKEARDQVTVEDMDEVRDYVDDINYLSHEGFIEIEVDENGEPRFY